MATIKDLAEQYGVAKAQEQNENLGRLAELLGSARDIGNEYKVPSWVPLAGGTGAGDLLMGKTPEEIENWSYGNAPMQIPEMSNVPQFKRGRAQSLADALTTLAPGVKATEDLPVGLAIKGYHGSPHKFKEFDTAHMGSGEGGQAYGWGNYITEDPYVATTYSPQDEWMDEQLMNLYNQAERRQDYPSMEVYERYMMHERPNEVKEYLKESYADYPEDLPKRLPAQKIGENLYKKQKGSHLYEVSMEFPKEREAVDPMSIEHFLDYDKPLSEQSDYVRNILQSHDPDMYHPEGPDYDPAEKGSSILQRFGSGKEGAQKLYELGIPGTTYMGEKAKVANPEGVRNFVTYSDEVPRVVTRNMNKVKPLTDEDRLNDLEKQMSAYMKTKRMPKGVDFKSGSDWYDWAYDKRAKLRGYAEGGSVDKDSLQLNKPQRTPNHPTKSHIVKTMVDGKEKIIRFGEQGAETAGKPKEGESDRMTAKRESFKARHAKNIAKGPSSAAYWADKVKWAEGGSVSMEDLPFNDPDQLRLYHQAMQHFDDLMENTGGSKKMGKTEARINYNTTTKGDRDRDKDLHTLIADYGVDVGKDARINATMIKPMEAEGVYLGNLTGSVPVGEGRASLGLQGLHTKYSDGLSGYTAGYNGKVGGGDLSASYFEPADHNSAGRQVQLEYSMPFADGGSVDTTYGLSLNHGLSGIASTANTSNDQPVVNNISPNQVADTTPKYKSPYYHAEFNPTGNLVYTTRPGTNPGMPDAVDRYQRDKDGNWHDYGTEGLVMYGDTPMTSRQNVELNLKNAQQKADDILAAQRAMVVVNAMPFNPFHQSWNDTMADPLKDPNNPAYQARQNVLDWQKHLDTFEPYKPFTPPQAYSHGGTVGYADGGSVSEFEDPAHERLYRRAMAHFDDMSAKQNFEDNDSMIASTILHPVEAAKRAGSAFMRSVDTAGGRPKQALDESSWYPVGIAPSMDEQAQAGLDLAGLAQTGAMPFAPSGAGSLGTIKSLNFGELDFDPRFAYDKKTKWELPRLKQMTVELDVPEKEIPVVGLDKAVNKGVSSGMSDRSGVQVIRSINDVPVDEYVKGGQPFMHHFGDFGWMSNQGPATALNNSALEMYNQTGDYPFFLPFAMSPAGSDFNPSTGLTMFKYMTNNMNKKEQKALNKDLKLFIPGFKGIETEEGREQFQSLKGDDRKEVQKFLHTNYRDKGGLSIGEVRLAMADQDQLTIPDGTLLHMARLYPDNAITKENFHQAYSHALKGIGLGKLDRHIMAHEIYPHIVEERKIADPRQPSLDDMTSLRYATTESRGIMTPEILRNIGYAFAKGGSVGLQELANKYM